jgi:hypothetical protein
MAPRESCPQERGSGSFAYQTTECELKAIETLGPFPFDATMYKAAVLAAAALGGIE